MEKLRILSLNCRGLNNVFKRKQVFRFLKRKQAQIYCLQDVHFTHDQEQLIKQQWGYRECYFSPFKSNARGTAILFNNNFNFEIIKCITDPGGNYVGIKIKISEHFYTIINVYGPNNDTPEFFKKISEITESLDCENIIWCGDWNLVLNPRKDTYNYKNINNPKARDELIESVNFWDLRTSGENPIQKTADLPGDNQIL